MCLLIAARKKILDKDALESGYDNNSHGAGFAYSKDNQLFVEKGFFSFDDFLTAYNNIPDNSPNIVHFRLATGGLMNDVNCHPFSISKNLAFAHNGIFSFIDACAEFSDTYHFNEEFMKPLFAKNNAGVYSTGAKFMIEKLIGYNKLAFLNNKGDVTIMNQEAGDVHNGAWYSNNSYMYARNFSKRKSAPSCSISARAAIQPALPFRAVPMPAFIDWLSEQYQEYQRESAEETAAMVGAS